MFIALVKAQLVQTKLINKNNNNNTTKICILNLFIYKAPKNKKQSKNLKILQNNNIAKTR